MAFPPEPYLTAEARDARLRAQAAALGAACVGIGHSVEDRELLALHLPASTSDAASAPSVLVNANIHGLEWISALTALAFIDRLNTTDADIVALRARANIWVVPCINVDGYARTERQRGRGTLKSLRTNANGVDLNRNFPIPKNANDHHSIWQVLNPHALALGGSDDVNRATFRGNGRLSEPEAAATFALCERERFVACVSLHSFMGTLIPPCVRTASDARTYRALTRAFQQGQQRGRRYRHFANRFVDVLTGELEDTLHHDLGCHALTVECFSWWRSVLQHVRAPSLFWRFNPRDPDAQIASDVDGIVAFLLAALEMPHRCR